MRTRRGGAPTSAGAVRCRCRCGAVRCGAGRGGAGRRKPKARSTRQIRRRREPNADVCGGPSATAPPRRPPALRRASPRLAAALARAHRQARPGLSSHPTDQHRRSGSPAGPRFQITPLPRDLACPRRDLARDARCPARQAARLARDAPCLARGARWLLRPRSEAAAPAALPPRSSAFSPFPLLSCSGFRDQPSGASPLHCFDIRHSTFDLSLPFTLSAPPPRMPSAPAPRSRRRGG